MCLIYIGFPDDELEKVSVFFIEKWNRRNNYLIIFKSLHLLF